MSLSTFSIFYYGYDITSQNNLVNIEEGGGELLATISIGSYSFTGLALALQDALNAAGGLNYTVTANRATRTYTIAASGVFSILVLTGSQAPSGPWEIIPFTADQLGDDEYTSGATGSVYEPPFILQDHVPTENWKQAAQSTVNKTASGRVELVKFGDEQFMQCNIKYVTDITQPSGGPILSNASNTSKLRTFMQYLITKGPVEFMADKNTTSDFETLLLDSSPASKDGTGFKTRELYDQGLPGYFETGVLIFRAVI